MPQYQFEDLTLHYQVMGEGRPIVHLHGRPLDHRQTIGTFEPIFETRPGWRRIYPDLPGMGRSPAPARFTRQEDVLNAVLGFIDAVVGDDRFVLTGTSYGGYLARGVVYHRAEQMDGLLLNVPAIREPGARQVPEHQSLVEDPELLAELEPTLAENFAGLAVVQSRALLDRLRRDIFPAFAIADQAALTRITYPYAFDVDARPEPFPAPTLFVMGRQDAITGYRDAWEILEDYPRATFAVLDRAGHGLDTEQKALFEALAGEWLERVEEYGGRAWAGGGHGGRTHGSARTGMEGRGGV